MNFDFTDEQKMLKDQVRRLLEETGGFAGLRAHVDAGGGMDQALWQSVAEMGLLGAAIPEAYGGIGLSAFELCVIAEELGRAVAPIPFLSSILMAAEAIRLFGSDEQKAAWLPGLASGELVGTFAHAEGGELLPMKGLATTFRDGTLAGEKLPVADAQLADVAVVVAGAGAGLALCVVDLRQPGVTVEPVEVIDQVRPHARIRFNDATAACLGDGPIDATQLDAFYDRAAVFTAFEQVGGADGCLVMAQAYAMERHTFGRPIGSYQAIKHRLADMYVENELARSNAYYAAWALANDAPDLPVAAAAARLSASEAFDFASRENLQIHGGIGYTWEGDCHFYLRRARLLALSVGAPSRWSDRLMSKLDERNAA